MGLPSEDWNDGVESELSYHFLTHEISFLFKVGPGAQKRGSLEYCEIWVNQPLPELDKFDVVSTGEDGKIHRTFAEVSVSDAVRHMAESNRKHGIASHWISPSDLGMGLTSEDSENIEAEQDVPPKSDRAGG